MSKTKFIAEPGKQVVVVTRSFDAPREQVFKAYTDPELIPLWWGPNRLMTVVVRMEVRMGGIWRFINRDASGNEFAFHGVYHQIASPECIVDTFEYEGMPGHVLLETTVFEEQNGQTKLTTTVVYQSVEDRDGMVLSGMEEGQTESLDRLANLLEKVVVEKQVE
jgi:uncharacterized protein YndB with AHSA1/START domain